MGRGMDRVLPPALPCHRMGLLGRAGCLVGLVRHPGPATAVAVARVRRLCVLCTLTAAVTGGWAPPAGVFHKDVLQEARRALHDAMGFCGTRVHSPNSKGGGGCVTVGFHRRCHSGRGGGREAPGFWRGCQEAVTQAVTVEQESGGRRFWRLQVHFGVDWPLHMERVVVEGEWGVVLNPPVSVRLRDIPRDSWAIGRGPPSPAHQPTPACASLVRLFFLL